MNGKIIDTAAYVLLLTEAQWVEFRQTFERCITSCGSAQIKTSRPPGRNQDI